VAQVQPDLPVVLSIIAAVVFLRREEKSGFT
jgi:hypothetical protein